MFATMKPYAPPPPPGAQPPPLWGSEDHVRELLGDRVEDVVVDRAGLRVDRFDSAGEFREFFKARYGPTIAVYKANAADPERARRSTATWTRSPTGTAQRAVRWSGSTCSSRHAGAERASDPGDELARQRLVERELQGPLAGEVRRELALEVVVLGTELGHRVDAQVLLPPGVVHDPTAVPATAGML